MTSRSHDGDYLKRLPPEFYRGQACVHWSLTIEDRKTGWLVPIFYYKFRELLTHAMFRYGICCPIYCLMPDHIHLLWLGILDSADQRVAMKFLRGQLNPVLEKLHVRLQEQPYDHVLRDDERLPAGPDLGANEVVRPLSVLGGTNRPGIDGLTPLRHLVQDDDVQIAVVRERQRSRDRRGGHDQHVRLHALPLQRHPLVQPEPMLLIDHRE